MFKKAKDIEFIKRLKFRIHIKSSYGKAYDSTKDVTVEKVVNYKHRGQKVHYRDIDTSTGGSFWRNEYPNSLELLDDVSQARNKRHIDELGRQLANKFIAEVETLPPHVKEEVAKAFMARDMETIEKLMTPHRRRNNFKLI